MAKCKDKYKVFKTSEATTKSWFRTHKSIDKYLNIIDLKLFRKHNTKWSNYAKRKHGTQERLFFEEQNGTKAIPNTKVFREIDAKKGINYQKKEVPTTVKKEIPSDLAKKTKILQTSLDADVILDDTIDGIAQLDGYTKNKRPIIRVHPELVRKDSLIHEFGHLYIDLLGGMSNNYIKKGRELLNNSKVETEVTNAYPELEGERLDKEILATAIGREGSKIFDAKEGNIIEKFTSWLDVFFNKLKRILGLSHNVAKELARQMLDNELMKEQMTGELSSYIQFQKKETIDPSEKELNELLDKIKEKIDTLLAKYKKTKKAVFKEDMKKLANSLTDKNSIKGIIHYLNEATKKTNTIEKHIKAIKIDEKISSMQIHRLRIYLGAFDLIEDVQKLIKEEIRKRKEIPGEEAIVRLLEKKEKQAKFVIANYKSIETEYNILSEKRILNILSKNSKFEKNKAKKQYEKEFKEKIFNREGKARKLTKNEEVEMQKYINSQLSINEKEIEEKEKEYIKKIIRQAPKDINTIASGLVDQRNISDPMIQMVVKLLDKADYTAMRKFTDHVKNADIIWREYYEQQGKEGNQEKLYEPFIEKINGKKTNHLVGKYLSSVKKEESKIWDKIYEKQNGKALPGDFQKLQKIRENHINPQWVALENLRKKSPNNPTIIMYDYLIRMAETKDEMSPPNKKLGIPVRDMYDFETKEALYEYTYKLPSIEKNTLQRLQEKGLLNAAKEGFKDMIIKDTSDTEFGELEKDEEGKIKQVDGNYRRVLVNEQGLERQGVPVHFRHKLNKEEQQSYDLMSITLMDYHNILNYNEKNLISADLELIKDLSSKREVIQKSGNKWKINTLTNKPLTLKDDQKASNLSKLLNSIIEDRLYGIKTIDMGDIKIGDKNISVNKIFENIMSWTGGTMLMLNDLAGSANLIQGKIMNFLERAGGTHYSGKDLRKAEALYWKDIANILNDVGSRIPKSTTNLLIEKFDALSDFSGLLEKFSNDTKFKSLMKKNILYVMQNAPEHYIQTTMMYSILSATKIKDKYGKEVSLLDAYKKENNKLILKEGYTQLDGSKIDSDFEFIISRKIKDIIADAHGNYDNNNQAQAQRYVAGKMGFMLRKWLVRGTQRRWRGISTASRSKEELQEGDIFFSETVEEEKEGNYVTAIRFFNNNLKNLKSLKFNLINSEWHLLTDMEKANVRRTITEVALMSLTYLAYALSQGIADDADDEEKNNYYYAAYLFRRNYSELLFYTNPVETLRLLQSPAASISMIEKFVKLIQQFFSPLEEYQRGDKKGELKIVKRATDIFPVLSQAERTAEKSLGFLTRF